MRKVEKFKWIITWVLILILLVPNLTFAATPSEESIAQGKADGEAMGTVDGDIAGRADKIENKASNYVKVMPTDAALISKFQLNKDQSLYQSSFIVAYRLAFELAYNKGYRDANLSIIKEPYEDGKAHGEAAGTVQGSLSAMIDFTQGNDDDWLSAYNAFIKEGSLQERYFLTREIFAYRNHFATAYRDSFMKAYIETFQIKNLETEIRNKNAKMVSMFETILYFDEEYVHFNLGVQETEMRTPLMLEFPKASLFEPTYFASFKTQNSFNEKNTQYTPVSSKYTIAVWNDQGAVTLREPVTLKFEYYGSERAGIYQFINNKWVYLYTEMEDGFISTQIPAGYYSGGEYAIFIDDDYKIVSDITFNWAYREIYSLMRRDVISDAQFFSPNTAVTRAQMAQMIYNAASAKYPLKTSVPKISDAASLGNYKKAVEYAVGKQYMKLDANGNFNPSTGFTYLDAEKTFSAMFTRSFKWTEISSKMMTQKYVRSGSFTSMNGVMTRAEAAFAIYMLIK